MDFEGSVDEYFPADEYREYQQETVEKARNLFEDGKKVVVVVAPTGTGKSFLDMTLARMSDKAIYTSPLVNLIDQVTHDSVLKDYHKRIYGRRNYVCLYSQRESATGKFKVDDCSTAICQRDEKFIYDEPECLTVKEAKNSGVGSDQCLYVKELIEALNSQIASMTFGYFLVNPHFDFSNWETLVVDEAHGIASQFISFASISLTERFTPFWEKLNIPDFNDWKDWKRWLRRSVKSKAENKIGSFGDVLDEDEQKVVNKCENIIRKIDLIDMANTEYVVDKEDGALKFTPIHISDYLRNYIWNYFDKILISSATFSSVDMEELGLDNYDYEFIKVPHTFPVENRPVYYYPVGKMTRKCRDETIGDICEIIDKIIQKESGNKGIVHTHSYAIQQDIMQYFDNKDKYQKKLIDHSSMNREQKLEEWKDSEYGVFVSVGMENGLDLKDDAARFNIITKVPWADLSDSYVDKRLKDLGHQRWYDDNCVKKLVQASGRTTRSKDDYSRTYILDESFQRLTRKAGNLFPDWFIDAVKEVESLEEIEVEV